MPKTGGSLPGSKTLSEVRTIDFDLHWAESDAERAAVYRLRYDLYVEQQGLFPELADHERRWLKDGYDDVSHVALATADGRAVGTVRLTFGRDTELTAETREEYDMDRFRGVVDDADIALLTRFLVLEEYRGRGVLPFQLLFAAWEHAAVHNMELILGSCEPHLVNRYRTLGGRPYGKLYNHPTSGALVPIALVTGDVDHLRRINSPMVGALKRRTRPSRLVDEILPLLTHDLAVRSHGHDDTVEYWGEIFHWLADGEEGLHGILDELSPEEASTLLAKSHILHYRPKDAIIRKGHVSRTLYMLLEGSLEVLDDGRTVARVKTPGEVVGEVAFFTDGQRMSDVVAGPEGAKVLALSAGNLKEIIASYGPMAAKFLHFIAKGLCRKLLDRVA